MSLDLMIRNYKDLKTEEELVEYSLLGDEVEDSDEDEEDKEGEECDEPFDQLAYDEERNERRLANMMNMGFDFDIFEGEDGFED